MSEQEMEMESECVRRIKFEKLENGNILHRIMKSANNNKITTTDTSNYTGGRPSANFSATSQKPSQEPNIAHNSINVCML